MTFNDFRSNLSDKIGKVFSFKHTDQATVYDCLMNVNNKSSAGCSGLPVTILKACNKQVVPFLTKLFNDCIDSIDNGMFVNEWKNAIVTPLHKKGALDDLNNYRGISVLPIAAKIFEHVLSIQIKQYFSSNNLFSEHQHGFRTAHSCETTLHEIVSYCLVYLDKKILNALLFIDFKKAFDMVDRDLLIFKLLNYGFNFAIKIIIDYFNGRSQVVKIDDILSNLADLLLGTAQGSGLGPLFFIIYIND